MLFACYFSTGRWFSLGTRVSSTNKNDHADITEILLNVELNTHILNHNPLQGKSEFTPDFECDSCSIFSCLGSAWWTIILFLIL
jgi:hypothetical protein